MPTSGDLLNRRFEKAGFGGYKAADVDSFIADLADTLSQNGREISELKRKLEAAENKLKNYENEEESLKSALLNAQRLADKIVNEANEKADALVKDAEEKAEITLRDAKIKVENLIDCAQSEITMRKEEAQRLKREVTDFKLSVMRLYKAQLELISEIPAENSPAPVAKQDEKIEEDSNEQQEKETVTEPETKPQEIIKTPEKAEDTKVADKTQENEVAKSPDELSEQTKSKPDSQEVSQEPQAKQEKPKECAVAQPVKTVYPQSKTPAETPEESAQKEEQPPEVERAQKEAAATMRTVKLNLRYNEKTGEYEPIDTPTNDDGKTGGLFTKKGKNGDGLKFGADYNIRTDSFNDGFGRRGLRRK